MIYNGSSELLTMCASAVTTFLFNIILMARLGEAGVSAITIVLYVNSMVNIVLFGLSQGMQPIISYNLGAKRTDRVVKSLKIALIFAQIIGIIAFMMMYYFSTPIVAIFANGDGELIALTNEIISFFVFAYFFSPLNIVATTFHTAVEKPGKSVVLGVLRALVFVGSFLIILPHFIGNTGIWIATPLSELFTLGFSIILTLKTLKDIRTVSITHNSV